MPVLTHSLTQVFSTFWIHRIKNHLPVITEPALWGSQRCPLNSEEGGVTALRVLQPEPLPSRFPFFHRVTWVQPPHHNVTRLESLGQGRERKKVMNEQL